MKKLLHWASAYSPVREWFVAVLAVTAIVLGLLEHLESRRIREVEVSIEQERLLDQAWDLMGERSGAGYISANYEDLPEENLVRSQRLVTRALTLDAENARAHLIRGMLLEAARDYSGALDAYDKVSATAGYQVSGDLARANLARKFGLSDVSADLLRQTLDDYPGASLTDLVKSNLAGVLVELEEYSEAEEIVQEFVDKDPRNCMARALLGIAQYMQEDLKAGEMNLEQAKVHCPDSQFVLMHLGNYYSSVGRDQDALALYEKASVLGHPLYDGAFASVGRALILLERYDEAEVALKSALERDPRNPNTYRLLGDMSVARSDFESSLRYYQKALSEGDLRSEGREFFVHTATNIAAVLIELEDYEYALRYAEIALNLDPDFAGASINHDIAKSMIDRKTHATRSSQE